MAKYEGFDPKSAESYIIFNLIQNTYLDQSLHFASFVQDEFREKAKRYDRGVKQAGFLVLWRTTMPSVLVETGFITNEEEESFLNSEQGQDYMASAIYRAFRDYRNNIESKSLFTREPVNNITEENSEAIAEEIIQPENTIRYMVQITSSSKAIPIDSEYFKQCKSIDGYIGVEELNSGGLFKYAIGNKQSYREVVEWSHAVRKLYPDAFVIATKNGVIIPVTEALKELGQ